MMTAVPAHLRWCMKMHSYCVLIFGESGLCLIVASTALRDGAASGHCRYLQRLDANLLGQPCLESGEWR